MSFDLTDVLLFMLLASVAGWFWHGHGVRERALARVRQHCKQLDIELLDGNVAFRGYARHPDAKGRKRFARRYTFEFTVTGERRHDGRIVMFGMHAGPIELEPYAVREMAPSLVPDIVQEAAPATTPEKPKSTGKVVQLSEWRRSQ